jgi:hypothetical protein
MIPTFGGVIDNANLTTAAQEASNVYKQMSVDYASKGTEFSDNDYCIVILKNGTAKYMVNVVDGVVGEAKDYVEATVKTYEKYPDDTKYNKYTGALVYKIPAATADGE